MKLSFSGAGISSSRIKKSACTLEFYRKHLLTVHQKTAFDEFACSINLPFSKNIETILTLAKTYRTKSLRVIVVVGIGGSNLGTQAVVEALPKNKVEMFFLDTVSDTRLATIVEALTKRLTRKEQFLLVYVSKSGTTMETNVNFDALVRALKPKYGNVSDRCVTITDETTPLSPPCKGGERLAIPKLIGGRFSVFSAVGLFPLAVAGYDVRALCAGAREAVEHGLAISSDALKLATITHIHQQNGLNIHNSFFFAPELESIGKWERQLFAESLGKEHDREGKVIHAGFTPIVSIGSTDLHSMAQLYFGGPSDKFTNLISVAPQKKTPLSQTMSAIVKGVTTTYQKLKLPFVTIEFQKLNERELGYFLQTRMLEVMYLGDLMNVNAFDQPAVELYKREVRKLMNNES